MTIVPMAFVNQIARTVIGVPQCRWTFAIRGWGHPQDCREEDKKAPVQVAVPEPTFSVTYRIDCRDAIT
jgi:hypothetical protein